MINYVDFNTLLGKTLTKIEGLEKGNDNVKFYCEDGTIYNMYHYQECCESVRIEDVIGDINNLIGYPLLIAEEINDKNGLPLSERHKRYKWTFYKLSTIKGYVTIRWYGGSNGYYSESVDFKQIYENVD